MNTISQNISVHAAQEVTRFGRELGVDLKLDETGNCYFEHLNGLRMAIMLTGDDQIVTAVALVSEARLTEAQVGEILTEFNWLGARTRGATLSWNPEARNFLLWYSRDANAIKTDDLTKLLTQLLSTADVIKTQLENRIDGSTNATPQKSADEEAPLDWMAQRA
ncbi:MAG: CesT family type III secretion system chaperone [Pseudomonadota bacterium]